MPQLAARQLGARQAQAGPLRLVSTGQLLDAASPLAANLAGYWAVDDGQGSQVQDSSGSNHGTWQGTLGSQWGSAGVIGGDGVFNGTDNWVKVPFRNWANLATQAWAISLWIFQTATPSGNLRLLRAASGANQSFDVVWTSANKVGIVVNNNGNNPQVQSGSAQTRSVWHHVLASYDGVSAVTLWVDNVTQAGGSPALTSAPTNNQITIGANPTTPFVTGQMDEIGLWVGRALTATEVAMLYNNGAGARPL